MPGEISLAHNGSLCMDEFTEFAHKVLERVPQSLEKQDVMVSRAKAHSRYFCQFMLVATANPCRCGYMANLGSTCARAPLYGAEYMKNILGPMMDRFDQWVEMPPVALYELGLPANGASCAQANNRIATAHQVQAHCYRGTPKLHNNAGLSGALLYTIAPPDSAGLKTLNHAPDRFHLSAPDYHLVLHVAHTVTELEGFEKIENRMLPGRLAIGWCAQAGLNQTAQLILAQAYQPV